MQSKTISNLLVICIALLTGGCAGLYQDDLDKAYQNGNLSAADYFQLKNQREAQRQAYLQQCQAAQRQQQQDIKNNQIAFQQNLERSVSGIGAFQFQPLTQQGQSTVFPNLKRDANLPTTLDMPGSSDMQMGKTKFGPDGRMWFEYRTTTGYTYWKLAQ